MTPLTNDFGIISLLSTINSGGHRRLKSWWQADKKPQFSDRQLKISDKRNHNRSEF